MDRGAYPGISPARYTPNTASKAYAEGIRREKEGRSVHQLLDANNHFDHAVAARQEERISDLLPGYSNLAAAYDQLGWKREPSGRCVGPGLEEAARPASALGPRRGQSNAESRQGRPCDQFGQPRPLTSESQRGRVPHASPSTTHAPVARSASAPALGRKTAATTNVAHGLPSPVAGSQKHQRRVASGIVPPGAVGGCASRRTCHRPPSVPLRSSASAAPGAKEARQAVMKPLTAGRPPNTVAARSRSAVGKASPQSTAPDAVAPSMAPAATATKVVVGSDVAADAAAMGQRQRGVRTRSRSAGSCSSPMVGRCGAALADSCFEARRVQKLLREQAW
eukprot:CAMPEP_0115578462 /NCGR_PEP_ID=MMETSP0272-20121206/3605_1 /TAXON_ID=71861 /ORGANISM="Scrippsiella trochoidea, Strain CCMP3099" /LENGTH=336 /DNA_ID=CAMNT_0003013315 /DNA_START=53 /DNA_END=1060 /DNA_ORIENTATION=+